MRNAFFLLCALLAVMHSGAHACGDSKYSDLELDFSNYEKELNGLGLKLKTDSRYGWVIEDHDGAQFFFQLNAAEKAEACLRINAKAAPLCGPQINATLNLEKNKMVMTDRQGKQVARVELGTDNGRFFIYPYDDQGRSGPGAKQIAIQPKIAKLESNRFDVGFMIELAKYGKLVSTIRGNREMVADGQGFKNQAWNYLCPRVEGPKGKLSMSENATVVGDGHGDITDLITSGSTLKPVEEVTPPQSVEVPATDR